MLTISNRATYITKKGKKDKVRKKSTFVDTQSFMLQSSAYLQMIKLYHNRTLQ